MPQALKKVALALAVVVFTVGVIGFLLPSSWRIERSTTVSAPPKAVFAIVRSLRTWPEWTSWSKELDPQATWEFEGPEAGKGAIMKWSGPVVGAGTITIEEIDPDKTVHYSLRMAEDAFVARWTILLEPANEGTRVTWVDEGELGMNPFVRYFGLAMEASTGRTLEKDLADLKRHTESEKR